MRPITRDTESGPADDLGERTAVVVSVEPGSPAAAVSLSPGDVVVEVDRKPVRNAEEFARQLDEGGASVLLLVQRGHLTIFVPLERPRT